MSTSSFNINVPKTTPPQLPLEILSITVDLTADQAVSFTLNCPTAKPPQSVSVGPYGPSSTSPGVPYPAINFTGGATPDAVIVTPTLNTGGANDPLRLRYQFFLYLNTDHDSNCTNLMSADETWTISASPANSIAGAAIASFWRPGCGNSTVPVVAGADAVATIQGGQGGGQLGNPTARPGVDAVLVLDRSGSMASPATLTAATPTRIDELQQAVGEFAAVWSALRSREATTTGFTEPTDNIGVTLFDNLIQWWPVLPTAGLNAFDPVSATIQSPANLATISWRGSTSIGGGLLQGDSALNAADPTRRRVLLLMSDGLQNTDPMVGVMGNQVVTYNQATPNMTTPLPNQANYQVYAVTVGPSSLVDASINQQVASATNGFYTNSETDATLLDQFFLELLQNFVRFTSWETFRLIEAQLTQAAPIYTATVPVSSTTTIVGVVLRPTQPGVVLLLAVTPPGETTPQYATAYNAPAVLTFSVPTSAAYNYTGNWTIVVQQGYFLEGVASPGATAARAVRAAAVTSAPPQPLSFNLAVVGDDIGLRSDLSIVRNDYVPGQPIQFAVTATEFGQPVKGIGSQSGDRMVVEVVKPGVGVGDLLASSTAPTTEPFATDPIGAARAKLQNQVTANPASLTRVSGDVVTLTDDGTGVYRGSYAVTTPGHYNFLFGVQGRGGKVGGFSRQQLKTVYVRAKPDATATTIQTSTQTVSGHKQLTISFTPRTLGGSRLGPGWANYFWLTTPGHTPFKAVDNMNGSYTAILPYTGLTAPPVALNFIDVALFIGDSVSPANLPVPLGGGTVLVPVVNPAPFPFPLSLWKIILLALLVLLIIVLIIHWV